MSLSKPSYETKKMYIAPDRTYYDQPTALDLWFEVGENHTVMEKVTNGETLSRLESLTRGFVERLTRKGVDGNAATGINRVKTGK